MIGTGLKKLAEQYGMKLDSGVAYGNLKGYATTLSEGAGWKRIDIATKIADPVQLTQLQTEVNGVNLQKEYRVQELILGPKSITIVFHDNLGTMKKLEAFIEWFYPLLDGFGAAKVNICSECGSETATGVWYLIEGVAYYFHESCAQQVCDAIAQEDTQRKQEDTGSYVQGLVGAVGGAILGAVVWALVLLGGYVASIVGFVIGWLAEKGYNLLHGKQGKAKVAILIFAVVIGVLLGTVAADGITLAQMIGNGELPGFAYGDIPAMILAVFSEDAEYRSATISNVLMGLLFAALGVFTLLRKAGKEVADVKVINLK